MFSLNTYFALLISVPQCDFQNGSSVSSKWFIRGRSPHYLLIYVLIVERSQTHMQVLGENEDRSCDVVPTMFGMSQLASKITRVRPGAGSVSLPSEGLWDYAFLFGKLLRLWGVVTAA